MANLVNISIYAQAEAGKRVFTVPADRVRSLVVGLWRRGFKTKTNYNGEYAEIMISKRDDQ